MNETSISGEGTVLRPFEANEPPPLPPVEPSKVIPPPPPVAAVEQEPPPPDPFARLQREAAVMDAAAKDDQPVDETPTDETAPGEDVAGPFNEDSSTDDVLPADFWSEETDEEPTDFADLADPVPPVNGFFARAEEEDADTRELEDGPDEAAEVNDLADDRADDEIADDETSEADEDVARDEAAQDEEIDEDDVDDEVAEERLPVLAGTLPDATPSDDTITLPRKGFLAGIGLAAIAVVGLLVLWQTAGGDGSTETVEAPPSTQAPTTAPEPEPEIDTSELDAEIATLSTDLSAAQAEVAGLNAEIEVLESRPPLSLPGSQIQRIVVGSEAKFISTLPGSIAVVGPFGGLALLNPETNQLVDNGNVAEAATRVVRTPSSVWITNFRDSQILQVDPATLTVTAAFPFAGPDGIAKDGDTLVVASYDGNLVARINPGNGETTQSVDVGGSPTDVLSDSNHGLWVAVFDTGELVQIDRSSFEILQRVVVGQGPVGLAADETHIWVANNDEGTIAKIDPATGEVLVTTVVGDGPTELVVVDGSVWVTVTDEGSLVQVDAESGDILTRTPLGGADGAGGGPVGIEYGDGALWIAMNGEQSVVKIEL